MGSLIPQIEFMRIEWSFAVEVGDALCNSRSAMVSPEIFAKIKDLNPKKSKSGRLQTVRLDQEAPELQEILSVIEEAIVTLGG